jgi:MFS family permease
MFAIIASHAEPHAGTAFGWFIVLSMWVGFGVLTAWLADQKKRFWPAWFFLGMIFTLAAILAVGLAPEGRSKLDLFDATPDRPDIGP